jgi:thiamine monophosphate kinase
MNTLKSERDQTATDLQDMAQEPNAIALHPAALQRYKRAMSDVADALATDKRWRKIPSSHSTRSVRLCRSWL